MVRTLSCRELIRQRGTMYRQIRDFFDEKAVLEVETPIFSQSGNTDPSIVSLQADFSIENEETDSRYAHTSPEFFMKRLLSQNAGSIYQICKVFRKGELGRLHNPEFSMLEWYRPGLNYHQLMDEVEALLCDVGFDGGFNRVTYAALFKQQLSLDIFTASLENLKQCAEQNGIDAIGFSDDIDDWLALLLSNLIEPTLGLDNPTFIYDYPASQAALANIRLVDNVAERFELYINGVEIANGYQELTAVNEYANRFERDNIKRKLLGLPEIIIDNRLLSDLMSGLPDSSGVSIGLDRLLMQLIGAQDIHAVLNFDFFSS